MSNGERRLSCGQLDNGVAPDLTGNPRTGLGRWSADATSIVHMILAGDRTATTPRRPTPLTMPSFAWKLTDRQIADVTTYVRNS
ncbi:MAG: c-type cytochrome [Rhizomicrobium sp.]